ncbi:hypothetical protein F5X68DRAFT_203628 [Plectosphaerella plurivora]|uniref:Secreted protein n=1 Tax=Plectosphaerella plurivora TaxID=936078 RepID=A0A9P8VI15_9PEZI|nr:hypothetical protein F5X68DRAFT_203628 [Plectosphaerella plurivora]
MTYNPVRVLVLFGVSACWSWSPLEWSPVSHPSSSLSWSSGEGAAERRGKTERAFVGLALACPPQPYNGRDVTEAPKMHAPSRRCSSLMSVGSHGCLSVLLSSPL